MYLILPVACTLFQSSKMIKFGHRPYSSYEKNMYLITMYSITLYLITAPRREKSQIAKDRFPPGKSQHLFLPRYFDEKNLNFSR